MCEICHNSPCLNLCPNAPEPPAVYVCSGCSEPIYEGERFLHLMGEQWCEDCVDNAWEEAVHDPE